MTAASELTELLHSMDPVLLPGDFVVVSVPPEQGRALPAHATIREKEGLTLVLRREDADDAGLAYNLTFSWITLSVVSELTAVGLTAAFAAALSAAGISANVLAGFHHDHLLVPQSQGRRAQEVLRQLAESAHGAG